MPAHAPLPVASLLLLLPLPHPKPGLPGPAVPALLLPNSQRHPSPPPTAGSVLPPIVSLRWPLPLTALPCGTWVPVYICGVPRHTRPLARLPRGPPSSGVDR